MTINRWILEIGTSTIHREYKRKFWSIWQIFRHSNEGFPSRIHISGSIERVKKYWMRHIRALFYFGRSFSYSLRISQPLQWPMAIDDETCWPPEPMSIRNGRFLAIPDDHESIAFALCGYHIIIAPYVRAANAWAALVWYVSADVFFPKQRYNSPWCVRNQKWKMSTQIDESTSICLHRISQRRISLP